MEAMETDDLDIDALDFFCTLGNNGPKSNLAANTSVGNSADVSRKGKKNKASSEQRLIATYQQNYKVPRPRIIKSDFRRYYANMWVNVFNSCDYDLMMRHLGTYYMRDVMVQQTDLREDQMHTPHAIPLFQQSAKGVEYLSQFWYKGMTAAPDLVCSLRHTFVKVRSDGTSAIKCCFILKGTQITEANSADPEGVARIARYQQKKASGIRGITITEAAIVAVAPPSMVTLPKALKLQNSTSSVASATSATTSIASTSVTSGRAPAKPPAATKSTGRVKLESNISTSGAAASSTGSTSADDSSVCSDNEGSISTKASISNETTPAYPVRAADSPDTTVASACDDSSGAVPVKRRRVEKSGCTSPTDGSTSNADLKIKAEEKYAPGSGSSSCSTLLDPAGKVDWLALAEDAFEAGTLEPAKSHQEKQYFYSDPILDGVGSAALVVPPQPSADASAGTEAVLVKLERGDLQPASRKTVITACLDCICSIELEMNADCKIISVALNYFR